MFILSMYVLIISLFSSLVITSLISGKSKISTDKVSHSGGFAIWLSFLFASFLVFVFIYRQIPRFKEVAGIYLCSSLVFIVGLVDDKKELSVTVKLLTQLIAAMMVMAFGVKTNIAGLGLPGNSIITILWILGITNAFNHLDIIDGLASGVALIGVLTFFLVAIITSNFAVALMLIALCGSTLGFFKYNFPKAKIYMGNSGSHFLGFLIGNLAIMLNYAALENRLAFLIPVLILGAPIFDTFFVAWVRILKRKPVWQKSSDHLPLRLIALGLSKQRTVLSMCLLTITFCLSSVIILYSSAKTGIFILSLLIALCGYVALKAKTVKTNE